MRSDRHAVTEHARGLLRTPGDVRAHLGRRPFTHDAAGPMRRDYRLTRFLHLTSSSRRTRGEGTG
jgi:hypothetical protein